MDFDLILRGAIVIDGTGGAPDVADVGVLGDRINAIGSLPIDRAQKEIDITGQVLCPGFIDIHTHSDISIMIEAAGESKVHQGVTTEVTGNCSISPFPLAPDRLDLHANHLEWINYDDSLRLSWVDLDSYGARLAETPPALNIAPLVGHGTVRVAVMGIDDRRPTVHELARMKLLIAESIDQGAFGMSTGLTVVPSAYGDPDEVLELVRVVADRDALYATHCRENAGEGFPAVEEAVSTSLDAGVRLQFSHAAINEPSKWGRADDVIELFERARRQGVDIGFDVYPYDASSSALTQHLPSWLQAGGIEAMRERISHRVERKRALRELGEGFMGGIPWFWDRVVISRGGPGDDWCVGMTIEKAAESAGVSPENLTLDLCLEYGNSIQIVLHYRDESDVAKFIAHDLSCIGSDGLALPFDQGDLKPHPRSFGTFPRLLGHYVRERGLLSLTDAVRKMTGAVAERLQLKDRGVLRKGDFADLVVFDPREVIDTATYADPARRPVGITHVLVNGQFVVEGGNQTDARPGKLLLRHS